MNPNFVLKTKTYDQATGTTTTGDVTNSAWASTFEFTVKRLPTTSSSPATPGSPASGQTYQIRGANASTIVLLADIVAQFPKDPNSHLWGLWLTYAPDPSLRATGLQPFGEDTTFGIGQANLSTVTRPPASFALAAAKAADSGSGPSALNGNATFVRLLWEASITNSGGFFLYYRDGDNGLPDYLFDRHGNAVLTAVLVYGTGSELYDCMNAVVVTDPINPSATALVAEAVPTLVSAPASLTLAEMAANYYADLADTAHRNATLALAPLSANVTIAVNAGTYMVPPAQLQSGTPGDTLAAIATWFGTTPAAIQDMNNVPWTPHLAPYTALRLPQLTVTANATAGDGKTVLSTLGTIAAYYGADVVGIVVDNQTTANLFASSPQLNAGPWTSASKLPPGSQLLELRRGVPSETATDPASVMARQFSLLGYQIAGNQYFNESNLGIPVGPISAAGGSGVGKLRRPRALSANAADGWKYQVTLEYLGRVKGATPTSSPYLGNGSLLQVDLGWYDLYGNTIASDLSTPEPGDSGPPNLSPVLLGYTDALVGLGQWPSANASWQVIGAAGSPQLELTFSFDTTRYDGNNAAANAATDLVMYDTLIAQMPQTTANPGTGDSNAAFSIATSLSTSPITLGDPNLTQLANWIVAIRTFLTNVTPSVTPPGPNPLSLTVTLPITALPQAQIFELTCAFTLARVRGVAEGEFAAVPGILSSTTALSPTMPATKAQRNGSSPGLTSFAKSFEGAYALANSTLKVAVGPNRYDAGVASSSTLWAVVVGNPKTPISFDIADAGAPLIFAPQPIANYLVSKPAGIWNYTSGTKIDFNGPPSSTKSFTGVDLDQWVRQLFGAVDALLGPRYIGGLVLLDKTYPGTLDALQAHKKTLAAMYAQQMALVFTDQSGSPTSVASMFTQAMYEQLGNAYLTQAALQYTADVYAGTIEPTPPNLYGPVTQTTSAVPGVAFTPAKFPLPPSTGDVTEPLTVLVTTPTQSGNTSDNFVAVNLTYTATNIEHQIEEELNGYQASSWLHFVLPPALFAPSLGAVDIPMILRAYPSSPIMAAQAGPSTVAQPTTVTEATEWTYAFTYSLSTHYPQDVVTLEVDFNVLHSPQLTQATFLDSFAALAEFITVYDSEIVPDLDAQLATLALHAPAAQYATALAAVQSVTEILERIAPVPKNDRETHARRFSVAPHRRTFGSANGTTYRCSLQETRADEAQPPVSITGVGPDALVITVTVPSGGGAVPLVEYAQHYYDPANPGQTAYLTKSVGPPMIDPTSGVTTQQYYVVTAATSKYVPFATAQSFGPRTVLYPGLQILDLQDAQASAYLTRNQQLVPGRTTTNGFVYKTPEVSFTAPCRPTIVQTTPIDISAIPGPPALKIPGAPRSLSDSLTALFYTLVQGASATTA
ncbi:MAG TPA: LysM domain-containing protein, partial [Candidatus Elarobacter sp.]